MTTQPPVVDWEAVPAARSLAANRVDAEMKQLSTLAPTFGHRRRRLIIVGIASGAAVALTGAVAYVAFAPVDDTSTIRCFTDTNLNGISNSVSQARGYQSGAPADRGADGPVQISDPVAACGDLWAQGVLIAGDEVVHDPRPDAHLSIPPLAACVFDDPQAGKVVAVFPGTVGVCARLGLPRWQQP